jgi:hypothetical protein
MHDLVRAEFVDVVAQAMFILSSYMSAMTVNQGTIDTTYVYQSE